MFWYDYDDCQTWFVENDVENVKSHHAFTNCIWAHMVNDDGKSVK